MENNIFSKKPFQRPNSYEFINAVKEGSLKKAIEILQNDRFLVYEFDQVIILLLPQFKYHPRPMKPPCIGLPSVVMSN